METREDLRSILPFLPVFLRSSSLFYPPQVIQAVKSLSNGPTHSNVNSGEILILAITDIRHSLGLSSLSSYASEGYALFFDELMSRVAAAKWFEETVPRLAGLLLRLPGLLEDHYNKSGRINNNNTLRLLESQAAGVVVLSQELIGALLSCALFCLFPTSSRDEKHLPLINFDYLFASLCPNYSQNQENKIMCLVHYFERISACMPMGFVSFERKVLGVNDNHHYVSYPNFAFWRMSKVSLCSFEVCPSGLIEDQLNEALEVDFANKYLGGGALSRGCVQEEIRFMINPELIVGMLFLPSMADNEAIEIVGAERFSNYTGYASTFLFAGDYLDKKPRDGLGRRKTRIVAIDALCSPRLRQYGAECLLREINKAFCGFYDQSKYHIYQKCFQDYEFCQDQPGRTSVVNDHTELAEEMEESPSRATGQHEARGSEWIRNLNEEYSSDSMDTEDNVGIVTGNWGCGAFGGDPELKAAIQWLAASQALRPFISYYTFQDKALLYLDQVTTWILAQGWTVGDLWNMLAEYSSQRTKGETKAGFFRWLLPALNGNTKSTLSET